MTTPDTIVLKSLDMTPLICEYCERPFAMVQSGALLITSKHLGNSHSNILRLEDIICMLQASLNVSRFDLICGRCLLPFAVIRYGVLIIKSHHSSETHSSAIRLDDAIRMHQEYLDAIHAIG